jgi:phosphoserine phosphatase
LVTGGFTCFTDRLRQRLGLDDVRANVLEVLDGRLTGKLVPQPWGDICDGEEKRRKLAEVCAQRGVGLDRLLELILTKNPK